MKPGLSWVLVLSLSHSSLAGRYCQPEDSCWPTQEEISTFAASLNPSTSDCWGSFASAEQPGEYVDNLWYPEAPDRMTIYEVANLRNKVKENKAFFVVIAKDQSDVVKAVTFATSHNIGISVFSTGHEFNDRNAGLEPNSLLIRTTCLRTTELELAESNKFGHGPGYARLGSGLTWGTSKFGWPGVHQTAKEVGRVVVSGHAGNVGIVGWSLGGGHGQLVGSHGLGVDQILEVEMVIADGSVVVANGNGTLVRAPDGRTEFSPDTDLYWAVRGGGAGPWGIVTHLTIKMHKPRNDCQEDCYTNYNLAWYSRFDEDDAQMAVDVTQAYMNWVGGAASRFWSSYGGMSPDDKGGYIVWIDALYTGSMSDADPEDFNSLFNSMSGVHTDKIVQYEVTTYNTFYDKLVAQAPESVDSKNSMSMMPSILLNGTAAMEPSLSKDLVDNWIPRCYRTGLGPACVLSYLFMHTLTGEEDDLQDDTAVSRSLRTAKMHLLPNYYISLTHEMSYVERYEFARDVVGPALYKHSEQSYYSESEFSLDDQAWKRRFWDSEKYSRLLRIKRTWDPEFVFSCRHCVGDQEEPGQVGPDTKPSWRWNNS